MSGKGAAGGVAVLGVGAAIALVDVTVWLAWLQANLAALLGERAQNGAVVETAFNIAIFAPLAIAGLVGGALERRNAAAAGDRAGAMAALGLILGVGGVSTAALYASLAGTLAPGPAVGAAIGMIACGLGAVAVQVVGEEIFFRGWMQPALVARWGAAAGVGVTALLFAGLHLFAGASAPLSLLNLLLGGLVFGLLALHGRGLAAAVTMHWGWNATEQLGWGLDPNPGIGGFGALFDRELLGAALWGGSDEGLNAGIGMTIVLLAILVPLAATVWRGARTPTPRVRLV